MPPKPQISLFPAICTDCLTLSALENHVFYNDEFSALAFGPDHGSEENIQLRAKTFEKSMRNDG
jgi:hypothetical protein